MIAASISERCRPSKTSRLTTAGASFPSTMRSISASVGGACNPSQSPIRTLVAFILNPQLHYAMLTLAKCWNPSPAETAVVLGALVFAQPRAVPQHDRAVHDPRLGQHLRVFHRDIVVDPVVIDARIEFRHMNRVRMEGPGRPDPREVVKRNHVHHQRVAFPDR